MKKKIISIILVLISITIFTQSISAVKLNTKNSEPDITFELTVEEKMIGYKIKTELIYNGGDLNWLYITDSGCEIYNEEDQIVWSSYDPQGAENVIGIGTKVSTTNIWTKIYQNGKKVPKGDYRIVGKVQYQDDDTFIPIETNSYTVKITKAKIKPIFYNNILKSLINRIVF